MLWQANSLQRITKKDNSMLWSQGKRQRNILRLHNWGWKFDSDKRWSAKVFNFYGKL